MSTSPDPVIIKDDNQLFLDEMNKKLKDPAKPLFTFEEIKRYYELVTGETDADECTEFLAEYCLPYMNNYRSDLCFYK